MFDVQLVGNLPVGKCYWNADAAAKNCDGRVVHGWLVSIWPDHVIEMLHHAIVVDKTGKYFDPTGYQFGKPDHISFVENNTLIPSRSVPEYIPSKFLVLNGSKGGKLLAYASQRQTDIRRETQARLAKLGYVWPASPPPGAFIPGDILELAQEHHRLAAIINRAWELMRD